MPNNKRDPSQNTGPNFLQRLLNHFISNPDNMREMFDEGGNWIDIFLATPVRNWSVFGKPSWTAFMGHCSPPPADTGNCAPQPTDNASCEKIPVGGIATVSLYPILGAIGFILKFMHAEAKATSLREIAILQRICKIILEDKSNTNIEEKQKTRAFLIQLSKLEHLKKSLNEFEEKKQRTADELAALQENGVGTNSAAGKKLLALELFYDNKTESLTQKIDEIKNQVNFKDYLAIKKHDVETLLNYRVTVDENTGEIKLSPEQKDAVLAKHQKEADEKKAEKQRKSAFFEGFKKYIIGPIGTFLDSLLDVYNNYAFHFWIVFSATLNLRGATNGLIPTVIQLAPPALIPLTYSVYTIASKVKKSWSRWRLSDNEKNAAKEKADAEEKIAAEKAEIAKLIIEYLILKNNNTVLEEHKANINETDREKEPIPLTATATTTAKKKSSKDKSEEMLITFEVEEEEAFISLDENPNEVELRLMGESKVQKPSIKENESNSSSPITDYFASSYATTVSLAAANRGMSYYLRLQFMIWLSSTIIAAIAKYSSAENCELAKDIEERQITADWAIYISSAGLLIGMIRGAIESYFEQDDIQTRANRKLAETTVVDSMKETSVKKGAKIDELVKTIKSKLPIIEAKKKSIESLLQQCAQNNKPTKEKAWIPEINIDYKFETFVKKYLNDNNWLAWLFDSPRSIEQLVNDVGNLIFLYRTLDPNWWNLLAKTSPDIFNIGALGMMLLWPVRYLHRVCSSTTKEKEALIEHLDQLIVFLEAELDKTDTLIRVLEQSEELLNNKLSPKPTESPHATNFNFFAKNNSNSARSSFHSTGSSRSSNTRSTDSIISTFSTDRNSAELSETEAIYESHDNSETDSDDETTSLFLR